MIDFCKYKWTMAMENGRLIHQGYPYMWYDGRQVIVNSEIYNGKKDWCAILYAEEKPNTIHHWDDNTYRPTVACGLLRSVDTFGYGTFSAEIQLPKGRNLWPAFWLVGEGKWPANGEIDIMEAWSGKYNNYFKIGKPQPLYIIPLFYWNTTTNIHWKENSMHKSTGSRRLPLVCLLKNPTNHFIKYEVEWRQDIITFRVNGKTVRTYGYNVAKHLQCTRQHVVFDLWTTGEDFTCETPMKIRNFEYKPIEIL